MELAAAVAVVQAFYLGMEARGWPLYKHYVWLFPFKNWRGGTPANATTAGSGGAGTAIGAAGGNGGNRGMAGQNGVGNLTFVAIGGTAGKARTGGIANIINNISGGQTFGLID